MASLDLNTLTLYITAAAVHHPHELATRLVEATGESRNAVNKALAQLVELGWLSSAGSGRQRRLGPGVLRQVVQRYPLAGLQEDRPWVRDFVPYINLPPEVLRMTQHIFCELLNNAIDHSGGISVTVSLRQTPSHVQLLVSDDGCGVFEKLARAFSLDDPAVAMLELSKGKLTSEPARHTGRGLFFASRLADVFDLHANEEAFQRREWKGNEWRAGRAIKREGSSIYAAISLDTARTLESVLHAHSLDGASPAFERTVVPLRLMNSPLISLDSRAQARRVAERLNLFRRVEVDFTDIPDVGHSFADELFRVLPAQLGDVDLVPLNMSPSVATMINTIRRNR